MAINENTALSNHSMMFLGASRSGKSWALKTLIEKSIKAAKGQTRVILWDPHKDHKADAHHTVQSEFIAAVRAALKKKKGFRIAWAGRKSFFEEFCVIVWKILDGDKTTHVVVEEMADVTGAGKAADTFGELVRGGGKYGARLFLVSQRPQEIPKTAFTQVEQVIIAKVKPIDAKYIAQALAIDPCAVMGIPAKQENTPKANQTTIHYLASSGDAEPPEAFKLVAK